MLVLAWLVLLVVLGLCLFYVQIECLNVMVKECLFVCGVFDVSVSQLLQH